MLEQLGLGVVLSLEDDFSEQSSVALQALDRLQSGAQNAVTSIQNHMLSMRNMMMTGFTFNELGSSVESLGTRVLGSFKNIYSGIAETGSQFENFRVQLNQFYGSNAKMAEDWAKQTSIQTHYTIQDIQDSMARLKPLNIDVMANFKEADKQGKEFTQSFYKYMSDLKSIYPSHSMTDLARGMQELWNGNARGMKQMFGYNTKGILGEDPITSANGTAQQFMEQFSKYVSKVAPQLTDKMIGTWTQVMSNFKDAWSFFKADLADSGVFDGLKTVINSLADGLYKLSENKGFTKVLGEALSSLLVPVNALIKGVDYFVTAIGNLATSNPTIAKMIVEFIGLSGVILTVSGYFVKMFGSALLALSSISMLIMNFKLMEAQGLAVSSMFVDIGEVLGGLITKIGLLGVAGAGLYLAWQDNFMGLRDTATTIFNGIVSGWQVATKALSDNSFRDALLGGKDSDHQLEMKYNIKMPPLAKMFGEKFLKIIAIGKAFWDVFTGVFDNGVMYFSKKDWDLFKATGIEGLVQGMVYAKEKINMFFQGFKEGLEVIGGLAQQTFYLIWTPLKYIIDAVENYAKNNPHGILGSLFLPDGGVGLDTANQTATQFENLGRVIGTVTGLIIGMKAITKITDFIVSPFKSLYNMLAQVGTKTDEVKTKLAGVTVGNVGQTVARKILGDNLTQTGINVAKHFNENDRTTKGIVRKDGKYSTVGAGNIDPTYYNYHLKDNLKEAEEIQVKNRTAMGKMFLGQQYYAKASDGSRRSLGQFGGILNMDRDDRNIRNRATSLFSGRVAPVDNTVDGFTHRVTVGDSVGQIKNLKGIEDLMARKDLIQSQISGTARSVTKLSNSQYDRYASIRQKAMGLDYASLANQARTGEFGSMQDMLRYQQYQTLGFDERNLKSSEKLVSGSLSGESINAMLRNQRAKGALAGSADYNRLVQQAGGLNTNQEMFRDNRQSAISRALFGQKYYTVNDDGNGNYTSQVVARNGGLLRRGANDLKYNDSTSTLGGIIRNSRPARAISSATQGARNLAGRGASWVRNQVAESGVGSRISSIGGSVSRVGSSIWQGLSNSFVGSAMGRVASVGGVMNSRLQKAGFKGFKMPNVKQMYEDGGIKGVAKGAIGGVGSAVKGTGRFLFGSSYTNAEGNVVRRAGMLQRAGGAVRSGAGLIGKGIGAVGSFAMRALPVAMLGSMAYSGISKMGAGKTADEKKQLGVSADAGNFQTGLAVAKKAVAGANFASMWKNFEKEAKGSFKIIADIAKSAWTQLKPMLPQIMAQAWEGIKAMAKIGWEWIKTDGVTLLGEVGKSAISLLGQAWDWIKTSGATMFGQLIGDILVDIVKLGGYIITNLPTYITEAIDLGKTIIQGLWDFTISVFEGIAKSIYDAITGAVQGLGSVLAGALGSVIRSVPTVGDTVADSLGLPKHHGGLWMSSDEHPAIIRKDETVLPPDVSRQLHDMLGTSKKSGNSSDSSATTKAQSKAGDSFKIDQVQVVVQADQLSREDARKQALQIVDEMKKMSKLKKIKTYQDFDGDPEYSF